MKEQKTRVRAIIGTTAVAAVLLAAGVGAGSAQAATTCTWAGTPDAPTGTFTVKPGVTNLPSPGPLKFTATGALGGQCAGTMTFTGQLDAGASCSFAEFEGAVRGLAGVTRFWGKGSLLVPSVLYDSAGNVVGSENAQILTETNFPHTTDCATPTGFTGGWPAMFSSVIELFGSNQPPMAL
jgi:hypothetical protein